MAGCAHGMPVSRRAALGGVAALGCAALLAGCAESDESGSADVDSVATIDVGLERPLSLDPACASDPSSLQVVFQLFEPLVMYDFATDELVGCAAQRYEVADDAMSFTFHLRSTTFHDGSVVRATDVKRAWERIVSPQSALAQASGVSGHAWRLSLISGYDELAAGTASELSGVTCPDDSTLEIQLTQPYADFPYLIAHPALAPVPAAAEEDPEGFATDPVGNGPFAVASAWDETASTVNLAAYEGWRLGAPAIESLRFVIEQDTQSSYQDYQTGALDLSTCPLEKVKSAGSRVGYASDGLTMSSSGRLVQSTTLSCSYLAVNLEREALADADARRALSLAIDRDTICSTLFRGVAQAADGIVPPHVKGYREGAWEATSYDAAAAIELLDELYPVDDEGDRGLSLNLVYYEDGGYDEVLEYIVEDLAAVGVTCELEALSFEELYERIEAGDFDLARLDAATDCPTLDSVLFPLFSSSSGAEHNASRYADDDVDDLFTQARATIDEEERIELLQQADATIGESLPVIPLVFAAQCVIGSDAFESLVVDPLGYLHLGTAELAS